MAGLILRDKPTDGNFDNDLPPRHRTKKAIYQTFVSVSRYPEEGGQNHNDPGSGSGAMMARG